MSEGGEGVIFDFLRGGGGGMDLFWNDPILVTGTILTLLNTRAYAEFKSESSRSVDPQFSHKLIFYLH